MAALNNVTVSFDQHSIRRIDKLTKAVERLANLKEQEIRLATQHIEGHLYQKTGGIWLHRTDICPSCTAESQSDNTKES